MLEHLELFDFMQKTQRNEQTVLQKKQFTTTLSAEIPPFCLFGAK